MADKIERAAGGDLRGKTVALWGLTFKAGTDDLRDSAAIAIARELVARGSGRPWLRPDRAPDRSRGSTSSPRRSTACGGAHVLFVGTEWPEFAERSLDDVAAVMASRAIVDGRNMLRADEAASLGFGYEGVGRHRGHPPAELAPRKRVRTTASDARPPDVAGRRPGRR